MGVEEVLFQVLGDYPQLKQYAPFIGAGVLFILTLGIYFYVQKRRIKQKTGMDRVMDNIQKGSLTVPIEDLVFSGKDDEDVVEKLDYLKTRIDNITIKSEMTLENAVRSKLKKSLSDDLKKTKEKIKEIRVVDHQLNIEMQSVNDKIEVIKKEKEKLKIDLIQASDRLNKLGEKNEQVEQGLVERIKTKLDDVSTKLGQLAKLESREKDKLEKLNKELKKNRIRRDRILDDLLVSFTAKLERSVIEIKVKWNVAEKTMKKRLKTIEKETKELRSEEEKLAKSKDNREEEKIGGMGKTERRIEKILKTIAQLQLEEEEIREKLNEIRDTIRKITSLDFKGKNKETRVQELLSLF